MIREAVERPSARGNDMIELDIGVPDGRGGEQMQKDLTNTPLGALRLRHACEAVGTLDRYNSGEISASDFPGQYGARQDRRREEAAAMRRATSSKITPCRKLALSVSVRWHDEHHQ